MQLLKDLKTVEAWHLQIKKNQAGVPIARLGHCLLAVFGFDYIVAGTLQHGAQKFAAAGSVISNED